MAILIQNFISEGGKERNGILPATLYPDLDIRFKVKLEPLLDCM